MGLLAVAALARRRRLGACRKARIMRRGPAHAPACRHDDIDIVGAPDRAGREEVGGQRRGLVHVGGTVVCEFGADVMQQMRQGRIAHRHAEQVARNRFRGSIGRAVVVQARD